MGSTVKLLEFSDDVSAKDHPDLNDVDTFIILKDGKYYGVKLSPVWFGYNMHSIELPFSSQFDAPGKNGCHIQYVWKVIDSAGLRTGEAILESSGLDTVLFAKDNEMKYATDCRNYAISHHLVYNGRTITEESPIEAWTYNSSIPKMERIEEDEDHDEDYDYGY